MADNNPAATIPPAQHSALFDEIGTLVNQSGGISGLAQQFQQKGLGGLLASWVSNGPNPPIGGEQVIQVLGHDRVMALAGKLGLSEAQVTSGISSILPKVVDELTPNGTVPNHDSGAVASALGMLKGRFFGS